MPSKQTTELHLEQGGSELQRRNILGPCTHDREIPNMVFDVKNRRPSRRMLTAVSGRYSNTVTNTDDIAGRLKDESLTIATKTYTVSRAYDSLGRLFQMTYPNSTVVERTYTDRNQLYTVKYGTNIENTRTYDDGGRLSTSAYRNGVTTTYNYRNVSGSKDNLLASIQFAHPGGTATNRQVGDLTYTWDANKNKTKETIAGTLSGYSFDTTLGTDPDGYDDEDRITYFKRSNTTNPQTWTLTSVGDWSSWKNFSTTAETRTHGAAHELTRIGSGTTPATILYDTKGNITQNQRTPGTSSTYQNYVWDFDNRMISADTNGDNTADVTYEYDALGRRVARTQGATAVVYIHAGQQTVCDYTRGANANTTPAFRYVWGDYIDEPILRQTGSSTLLYYHHNQQYSTVALTSASGLVVTRYGYTAYGEQTILSHTGASQTYATYSNRISYTGRDWDDSLKAHYFRARWYDAALGRFVNRDPIGYVDGMSLYRAYFVPGATDPEGTKKVCCTFDNGSTIWNETYNVGDNETPTERCKRRATWGWGKDWKVLGARYGACGAPKPPGPVATAAGATCFFLTADACTPDPTDVLPPKWVCYAVVGTIAGVITYQCCKNIDPCWSDYEACLLSSLSGWHNRCWDCYLACSGLGVWRGRMNGIDCAYWNH